MKGQKIIIPTSLKQQYISKIHAGHTGIGSCLKKAWEFIFWVHYSKDIQEAIEKCSLCQEQQNVLTTNQHYVSEVPPHPWHTLGLDLFYHKRLDFLVVVDYFFEIPDSEEDSQLHIQCNHQRVGFHLL